VVPLWGFDTIEYWGQLCEVHADVGGSALPVDPYPLSVAVAVPGGDCAWDGGDVRMDARGTTVGYLWQNHGRSLWGGACPMRGIEKPLAHHDDDSDGRDGRLRRAETGRYGGVEEAKHQ
jgi:hypothetical protein